MTYVPISVYHLGMKGGMKGYPPVHDLDSISVYHLGMKGGMKGTPSLPQCKNVVLVALASDL